MIVNSGSATWQGSIKEVATMAFVAGSAVAVAWWARELSAGAAPRTAVVPAVPVAAAMSVSSVGVVPWIGIVLLFALGAELLFGVAPLHAQHLAPDFAPRHGNAPRNADADRSKGQLSRCSQSLGPA